MKKNDSTKTRLVGYWNGDVDNPDIVFNPPKDEKTKQTYTLVVIDITHPFETNETPEPKNTIKKIDSIFNKKTVSKLDQANNSLKKLNKVIRRFK